MGNKKQTKKQFNLQDSIFFVNYIFFHRKHLKCFSFSCLNASHENQRTHTYKVNNFCFLNFSAKFVMKKTSFNRIYIFCWKAFFLSLFTSLFYNIPKILQKIYYFIFVLSEKKRTEKFGPKV